MLQSCDVMCDVRCAVMLLECEYNSTLLRDTLFQHRSDCRVRTTCPPKTKRQCMVVVLTLAVCVANELILYDGYTLST